MSFIENIFHSKSNERLRQLLEAIRTRDFTLQYSLDKLSGEEKNLVVKINEIVNEFRETTMQMEAQHQYFGALLDTVNAFLLVVDEQGNIRWMNRAAIDGLCGFRIHHVKDLATISENLPQQMAELQVGHLQLIQIPTKTEKQKVDFSLSVVRFFNKGFNYKLYTFQNVQPVIQKSETEAQQQLVRVLTHEIMNSLTPIISLSDTLCEGIENNTLSQEDTLMAVQAIHRRSNGLMQFVENYRKLQHLPEPYYTEVKIGELITDLQHLFSAPIFHFKVEDPTLCIKIDRSQIEQVLINLLKNGQEAGGDAIKLSTHLSTNKHSVIITVTDNGRGILPDVLDRIFVPFFTTKTKGSGIGLSICKQIVTRHGGTITASSVIGDHTSFVVTLPYA